MERLTRQKDPEGKELTPCSLCYMADLPICKNNSAECWELAMYERLAAYEDTDKSPEEVDDAIIGAKLLAKSQLVSAFGVAAERLYELAEADKAGRVVVLPCKVGQRVFALLDTDKYISECEVKRIGLGNEIGFAGIEPISARGREYGVSLNGFGKTVFLTREEAEKALEGRK